MRKKSGRITNIAMLAGYLLAMTPEAGATSSAPATPWSGITPEWALKMPPDTKNLNDEEDAVNRYEDVKDYLKTSSAKHLSSAEVKELFTKAYDSHVKLLQAAKEWIMDDFIPLLQSKRLLRNKE